jgi:hypothetical protein
MQVLGEQASVFRESMRMSEEGLLMTPQRTHTDGFYVSLITYR